MNLQFESFVIPEENISDSSRNRNETATRRSQPASALPLSSKVISGRLELNNQDRDDLKRAIQIANKFLSLPIAILSLKDLITDEKESIEQVHIIVHFYSNF